MSETPTPTTTERDDDRREVSATASDADLAARLELLTEENDRLRDEYRRARRASYRRTALGMAGLGVLTGIGGVVFPSSRSLLFALAGMGLFAAVLTLFLTPEQFVSASVGERTYVAHATTGAELVETLGLSDTSIYLPPEDTSNANAGVRLFVPQYSEYDLPAASDVSGPFVVTDDERQRGLAVPPTGAGLFSEFESMVDWVDDGLPHLADQLADTLVEGFELVESATPDVDTENDRVTVAITGSRYGDVDRFDHPVGSFVAVGLANGMERPVTLECNTSDDDRVDYLVTCTLITE